MCISDRYEILDDLPPYGPMYISITDNADEPFVSEGYVIRFYKKDGSDWVANFRPGWTDCSFVKDYPDSDNIIVIANGMGYIVTTESEKPIETFGISIKNVLEINKNNLLISDDIGVEIINENGIEWKSPRISWDGIKNLSINDNILTGLSFDPMNDLEEWCEFSIDLITKEINGGSYRKYYTDDNRLKKRKPWWKIWN